MSPFEEFVVKIYTVITGIALFMFLYTLPSGIVIGFLIWFYNWFSYIFFPTLVHLAVSSVIFCWFLAYLIWLCARSLARVARYYYQQRWTKK